MVWLKWLFLFTVLEMASTVSLNKGQSNDGASYHRVAIQRRQVKRNLQTYILEIKIIADPSVQRFHGNDTNGFIMSVMKIVDNMFKDSSLNTEINVMVTDIQTRHLQRSADCTTVLCHFCRMMSNDRSDVTAFITRDNIASNLDIIGQAPVGSLCREIPSCIVVMDTGLVGTAITIAHDIGHLFGMRHDGEIGCGPSNNIMSSIGFTGSSGFQWSSCSAKNISRFLQRTGRNSCLSNLARNITAPIRKEYSKDEQCQLEFGKDYTYCNVMCPGKTDPCESLTCRRLGEDICVHGAPMADHSDCSDEHGHKWCIKGSCTPFSGSCAPSIWSSWGSWTPCTRACGGGITYRRRQCQNVKEVCRHSCPGLSEEVMLCNVEKCTKSSNELKYDFCRRYNSSKGDYPCHCNEKNNTYIAYPDGTDVNNTIGSRQIQKCVRGKLRNFGCDGVLDSGLQFDDCNICNGDGSKCQFVSGTYNKLPTGNMSEINKYKCFLNIPVNSTGIKVKNHLHGFTEIGAKYTGRPGFFAQGETLKIQEPAQDDIEIHIAYFEYISANVSYQYKTIRQYGWISYCSSQMSVISCKDLIHNTDVDKNFCIHLNKPAMAPCTEWYPVG